MPNRETKRWEHYRAANTSRALQKEIKRNRKPKRVRRRDWMPESFDDQDELFSQPLDERVMPRGERERRLAVLAAAVSKEQESAADAQALLGASQAEGTTGVVVEVSSSLCRVDLGGRQMLCGLRGSLTASDTGYTNVIAVGDEVIVRDNGSEHSVVEAILPRRSVLARPDVHYQHLQQIIVANADQVLVVASWKDPLIWFELVDRYVIAAERNSLVPVICVNKIDLADSMAECREALRPYRDLGYQVLFTSASQSTGVADLCEVLQGRTTVLAGLSGVGKSSLAAAVEPGLRVRTGAISETHREGKHITTQVTMFRLGAGGFLVDTPGIREWGLAGISGQALRGFYPEIRALQAECRFADCGHTHEPGCAVVAAVEQGRMSATRYHSYTRILESLAS